MIRYAHWTRRRIYLLAAGAGTVVVLHHLAGWRCPGRRLRRRTRPRRPAPRLADRRALPVARSPRMGSGASAQNTEYRERTFEVAERSMPFDAALARYLPPDTVAQLLPGTTYRPG